MSNILNWYQYSVLSIARMIISCYTFEKYDIFVNLSCCRADHLYVRKGSNTLLVWSNKDGTFPRIAKCCSVITVSECNIVKPRQMGSTGNMVRSISGSLPLQEFKRLFGILGMAFHHDTFELNVWDSVLSFSTLPSGISTSKTSGLFSKLSKGSSVSSEHIPEAASTPPTTLPISGSRTVGYTDNGV